MLVLQAAKTRWKHGHHTNPFEVPSIRPSSRMIKLRQLSRQAVVAGALAIVTASVPLSAQRTVVGTVPPPAPLDTAWHATLTGPIPLIRRVIGVRADSGAFRELYQTPAGTSSGAHRHTADMWIKVLSGRQFILMGDLEHAQVQRFDVGSTFVIPANTWHVEWFEEDTLVEIFGVGPMRTERPPTVTRPSAMPSH